MRAWKAVSALILAGCATGPSAQERADERAHLLEAASRTGSVFPRGIQDALGVPPVLPFYALHAGVEGDEQDLRSLDRAVTLDASPELVAAAAMGLGYSKHDAAEGLLLQLARREPRPPEAVEALFSYYRFRGADKPPPAKVPDATLLAYADHPTARGRAALAHLGRVVKDPALIPVLEKLAKDADWEVRRAVALSLADGPAKTPRLREDAQRCLATLRTLANDADAHVVASTCRALASYDDEAAVGSLFFALHHADFNVRVAAIEGLGKRKAAGAVAELTRIAKEDKSTSCRYAAGTQLAEINPVAARGLVEDLLGDKSVYVRTAAAEILGKADDEDASNRLAAIYKHDPHVRVRETAVGALEGKKDAKAKEMIRVALADKDVGVVSTACGVVGKNGWWIDELDSLLSIPARFPGCDGADAREAALSAMSGAWNTSDPRRQRRWELAEAHLNESNPAVREAAEKLAGKEPKSPTRGADLTGELLPGGAPIFDKDVFLIVETDQGTMKIRLFPDQAPVHCAHVVALARTGFYDGLTWHRVVPDFVIQGGCPRGDGSGNAGVSLPLEPTTIPYERGTLGMPRSNHPDTGGCQLFICHSRAPHLDVRYTAFGKVVEGFEVIDRIDVDNKIVRVRVEGAR
jgi:peptidyl-prolyl cis-trans isomerase B (cyclophilin B)